MTIIIWGREHSTRIQRDSKQLWRTKRPCQEIEINAKTSSPESIPGSAEHGYAQQLHNVDHSYKKKARKPQ